MEHDTDLIVVEEHTAPLFSHIAETYTDAFPDIERRDLALFRDLLHKEPDFSVHAILYRRQYAGFITSWTFERFSYIEHFAVDAGVRNGGVGSAALNRFLASIRQPVFLEVELPEEEMAIRRIGFYTRLGFVEDPHFYFQPPYREGGSGLAMRLMVYGGEKGYVFEDVKRQLYEKVYDFSESLPDRTTSDT